MKLVLFFDRYGESAPVFFEYSDAKKASLDLHTEARAKMYQVTGDREYLNKYEFGREVAKLNSMSLDFAGLNIRLSDVVYPVSNLRRSVTVSGFNDTGIAPMAVIETVFSITVRVLEIISLDQYFYDRKKGYWKPDCSTIKEIL